MKKRTGAAGAALLLLAFAAAVTLWIGRRSPPAPTANVGAPGPAAGPVRAQAAIPEAPAALPTAATNAGLSTAEPAQANPSPAAAPAARSSKASRSLAEKHDTAAEAPPAGEERSAANEPVAAAEPTPAEPTAKDPAPAPEAKTQKPADGSALGSFQNRVGPSFSLARVVCQIDGQTVYSGPGGRNLTLFQRNLAPGGHSVSVVAEYRGNTVGVFSYAQGYRFKVSSGRRFNVVSGKPVQVSITGYEKGGPTQTFDDRLALAVSAR
jgi:hypothetical protein